MENKKKKISIIITSVIMVALLAISITYALFSARSTSTEQSVQAGTVRVVYTDNLDSVTINNIAPIYDSDIMTDANKFSFNVENTGATTAYVDISLTNIVMDTELSNLEFKWALYSGSDEVSNGNFRNVSNNEQLLTKNIELAPSQDKYYQLYIWISESDLDQSNLMNKSFSAKITVMGNQTKGADLLSTVIKNNNSPIKELPENYDLSWPDTRISGLLKGTDDDGETYYFRDEVENNYLKIEGLKWSNVDYLGYDNMEEAEEFCTNNYGPLLYNSSEECINDLPNIGHTPEDDMLFRIVRINGDGTIRLIADGSIGNSVFNENINSEEYVGYTYKPRIGYKLNADSSAFRVTNSTLIHCSDIYYSDKVDVGQNGEGYMLIDPVKYSCEDCKNGLCNGKYTNFSTTVSGRTTTVYKVNSITNNSEDFYVYQYNGEAIYDENANEISSTIKTYLDNWYNENLSEYDNLIASTRYCNDTSNASVQIFDGTIIYNLANAANDFVCLNTHKSYGGEYDLKVGLLNLVEAEHAGVPFLEYHYSYLFDLFPNGSIIGSYWLMTPISYPGAIYGGTEYGSWNSYVHNGGSLTDMTNKEKWVVPVINLKSDILYTSGDGTESNPYIITLNQQILNIN